MADDSDSFTPGFLDTLVPGLRQKAERFPALPVHPRVVHAAVRPGQRSVVLASFAPAASQRALHAALKRQVEGALLAELSRPGEQLAADESRLAGVELICFAPHPFDCGPVLAPFALMPAPRDDHATVSALALLRRELQFVDGDVPDEPVARYSASLLRSPHPLAAELARALRAEAPGPWGERPGALARAAADRLAALGHAGVEPTRAGIERLEAVVVHPTPGVVRWMDPLLFQALCDLVAVMAVSAGLSVEWGVSEPDPDTGLAPPPLIRVTRRGESFHVPLGEHVLRWCVMPMGPGEAIPSLGAWAEHELLMIMRSHIRTDVLASRTLGELARRPDARVEHAAIWIARDAHPQLNAAQVVHTLDQLASDFEGESLDDLDAHEQAAALVHHVGMRHGFRGNPREYYDPENSYLDSVLRRKQGIPITLAVVYVAVGERVGIPVAPIGFPGHFLVRVGRGEGVYVDPFEGRILAHADLELLLSRALGPSSVLTSEHLTSVSVSQLAQRMLLNLKRIHDARRDHARAFLTTERLVELATSPELRRDRGLLALKLGAHQVASMDLAHYLLKRPNAKDAKEVRSALSRSRKGASLTN